MAVMTTQPQQRHQSPWLALRQASGLSQREVERRLGWEKQRGHLSLIERGIEPSPEREAQLKAFYAKVLTGEGS